MSTLQRYHGRHRVADQPLHEGWEGDHTDEMRLLAGRELTTTTPRNDATARTPACCPVDQCPWPTNGVIPGVDHRMRLLQHVIEHSPQDWINTVCDLQDTVEKLQANT